MRPGGGSGRSAHWRLSAQSRDRPRRQARWRSAQQRGMSERAAPGHCRSAPGRASGRIPVRAKSRRMSTRGRSRGRGSRARKTSRRVRISTRLAAVPLLRESRARGSGLTADAPVGVGPNSALPGSPRTRLPGLVAELPCKHYDRGKRDGLRGVVPISPWSPPASAWSQLERRFWHPTRSA